MFFIVLSHSHSQVVIERRINLSSGILIENWKVDFEKLGSGLLSKNCNKTKKYMKYLFHLNVLSVANLPNFYNCPGRKGKNC